MASGLRSVAGPPSGCLKELGGGLLYGVVVPVPDLSLAVLEGPVTRGAGREEQIAIDVASRFQPCRKALFPATGNPGPPRQRHGILQPQLRQCREPPLIGDAP